MKTTRRKLFLQWWVTTLANAMAATGRGYRRHSLRNTGRFTYRGDSRFKLWEVSGRDCRKGKAVHPLPLAKAMRGYRRQYGA